MPEIAYKILEGNDSLDEQQIWKPTEQILLEDSIGFQIIRMLWIGEQEKHSKFFLETQSFIAGDLIVDNQFHG